MPISERKMFTMWREAGVLEAKGAKLLKAASRRKEAIIKEFERRGIKSLTEQETGERITFVQAEPVVYDKEGMQARLSKTKRGREILARCTVEVLDMKAIAAEVQAGNIPPEIVAACSEIKKTKPYLRGGGPE